MLFYGQLVIGPAGSGKSTYCGIVQDGATMLKRKIQIINLDPAAEYLPYKCVIDVRELICLQDVMEEMQLGPNGGLVYCMEYLLQNINWLQDQFNNIAQDDYVMFDCPGQIEIFDMLRRLTKQLTSFGFSLCTVYLIDVNFIADDAKFLSGLLMALSSSMTLELPYFTVLSKCDLVSDKKQLKRFTKLEKFNLDSKYSAKSQFNKTYQNLTEEIHELFRNEQITNPGRQ